MKLLVAFALLLVVIGCGDSEERPPDVVLIVLDTLRSDRVGGAYGRAPSITPELDEFAAVSTSHLRTWATSPWTLPSHASMFTGQYTFEHGARTIDIDGPNGAPTRNNNVLPLEDGVLTLAERLHLAGYRTGAIVANEAYVTPTYGMDQGFDHFDVFMRWGDEINAAATKWMDEQDGTQPLFLFLNYMDAHRPYNLEPREGFATATSPTEGVALLNELYRLVLAGARPLTKLERLADLYDLSVANLDEHVGALLDELRARGRFEDALIIITSDHGEFLGEHDLIEHSKDVYEPVMRIPLMVKAPGQSTAAEVWEETSLVHVPWLAAQHVPALEPDDFPYAWPDEAVLAENHFTRIKDLRSPWAERFKRSRHVFIDWPYKHIDSSDGENRLFDLEVDPEELQDLWAENDSLSRVMAARLQSWMDNPRATTESMQDRALESPELSPEEMERLRSLGYF